MARELPHFEWRHLEAGFFALGAALLVVLLVRLGPGLVARDLSAVGSGFLLVVALQSIPVLLNSLSWRLLLPPASGVPLRTLTPMLLAGEALNTVSPVGFIGGELVRIGLLRRRIGTDAAAGAVGLAAMTQFAGQALFVLAGLPAALLLLSPGPVRTGIGLAAGAIGALLAAVLLLASSPVRLGRARRWILRFPGLARLERRIPDRVREGGALALASVRSRPGAFALSIASSFAAWSIGVVETLLVLSLLGHPIALVPAVAIETMAVVIEGVLFFVPAKMGTQEGGRVLIFTLLGLPPSLGLALGLVRRAKELVWAVPGLTILGVQRRNAARPNFSSPTA